MNESPIGALIVDAETKAKKKKRDQTHVSKAECGCQVTVSWFSENSRSNKIEPCADHPVRKQAP